jgi:outer membrane protein OmpA-like peptidoglycan-associated protein
MKRKLQYWLLLGLTAMVLASWALNLLPAIRGTISFCLMLILMLSLILLHYYYLSTTPVQFVIEQPENNQPSFIQRQPVMLIVGPYVDKWFSHGESGLDTLYSDSLMWLSTNSPQELTKTVANIQAQDPETPIIAFMPILPDVHENANLMINTLINWRNNYAAALSSLQLPIVIAFYSKMSYAFSANNGENIFWTGQIDFNNLKSLNIDNALLQATAEIQSKPENTLTEMQQSAFIRVFTLWLNESKIKETIAKVVNSLNMKLDNILFCDDSVGISRHGAWSYWLEQHCGILPATGRNRSKLALPRVVRPIPVEIPPPPPTVRLLPIKYPAILWSIALTLLLLSINYSLLFAKNKNQIQNLKNEIVTITAGESLSIQKLKYQEKKLAELKKSWLNCPEESKLATFGITPCQNGLKLINQQLSQLSSIPYLSTQDTVSIYDSGSARVKADAKPVLDKILALVKKDPDRIVQIVGYSDNTGNEKINLSLSQQRADGIKSWLIHEGIASEKLKTVAMGASEPIASNEIPEGRKLNRRVEILILPPEK